MIGAAIEVHRQKGPGLLESIYEKCLMRELELRAIPARNQRSVPVEYKGLVFEETLKLDVFVDDCLILELKAVETVLPIHKAQLLSYLKLLNAPIEATDQLPRDEIGCRHPSPHPAGRQP